MWNVGTVGRLDPDGGIQLGTGVRLSSFYDLPTSSKTRLDLAAAERARREGAPMPPFLLDGIGSQAFHSTAPIPDPAVTRRYRQRVQARTREFNDMVNAAEVRLLAAAPPVVGEHAPGSVIDDFDFDFTARFLYAFFRLCEQKIATNEAGPVNHSARVLAERTGTEPDVRIIRMRSPAGEPSAALRGAQWQHRWVVQMHKVRQWYPTQHRHKIILRGPYIKGPADKPLLNGTVIRAWVR
jgi:hypothetical protein